jgi:3beta-hydroxy-delta5-steroid dehydrogenase/steroid delta-isomerase
MNTSPIQGLNRDDIGASCLVTGGAGYLGRYLVAALLDLGCEVRVIDTVATTQPGVLGYRGDILDEKLLKSACRGVDTVFHTAAISTLLASPGRQLRDRLIKVNVGGTRAVLRACKEAGVSKLVYTSTADVVLDRELLEADETLSYATGSIGVYAASKIKAEHEVLTADNQEGLRTIALRPGRIWGPGAGGTMIRTFLTEVADGRFVATFDNNDSVSDNTYVHSLVYAELLAAKALGTTPDVVAGQPYFITDDEHVNALEWFRPLLKGLGVPWPHRKFPHKLVYCVAWVFEWAHHLGAPEPYVTRIGVSKVTRSGSFNIDRARRDLGYKPLMKHKAGLAKHMGDYRALFRVSRS